MGKISDISAFGDGTVASHWWQWVLIAVMTASGGLGLVSAAWYIFKFVRKFAERRSDTVEIPKRISDRLEEHFRRSIFANRDPLRKHKKPASFGVYLGSFQDFTDEDKSRLFDQYELLVLDPSQSGVLDTLACSGAQLPPQVVARLDLYQMLSIESMRSESQMLRSLERIVVAIEDTLLRDSASRIAFNGVALAGWHNLLSTPLLNALAKYLVRLSLHVYLEIVPPHFLDGMKRPDLHLFAGVIVRNGTILPNGEVRDFFQMEKMKSTVREFVSQSCLREFSTMMWEPIDDRIEVSHAVVKRSYQWCSYHGAIVWIGSEASIMHIEDHTPVLEPLAAFQWLKEGRVMKIHEVHRKNRTLTSRYQSQIGDFEALEPILPSVRYIINALEQEDMEPDSSSTLTLLSLGLDAEKKIHSRSESGDSLEQRNGSEWSAGLTKSLLDPLSSSSLGTNYTGLGCFPLGLHVSEDSFAEIVKSQRRLRRLGLLTQLSSSKVRGLAVQVQQYLARSTPNNSSPSTRAIREFADLLGKASDLDQLSDPIQLYFGIDSGFHATSSSQFWSVYEIDRKSGALVIYVSKDAQNMLSTVMHCFLSSRGISRYQCFLVEVEIDKPSSGHGSLQKLPGRLRQDMNLLSPTELLLFMQQFRFSAWDEECALLSSIRASCQELLLEVPSFMQLKKLANEDYLEDSISTEDLIAARISWYRQYGFNKLDVTTAKEIFTDVHFLFRDILHSRIHNHLNTVTKCLERIILTDDASKGRTCLDPFADMLAFSFFCAARKAAFEEVYVEVCDRNPLFNEFSDQSAAFAELFALGSRCDAYFDISPSAFGRLLSNRHREYYSQPPNQPPMWIHNAPAFASAYSAAQTDIDPDQRENFMPAYRKFTFLSVFAIPALIDITLLTVTRRGLYLSAFMTKTEQQSATLALMISLLLSGAIGTWISIGGTYYLISMAFSAANMFVLTRLIGGLALTVLIAIFGFIVITAIRSFQAGIIFFLYLVVLTTYLSVLAAISSFQFPGSSFLNGRTLIICIIPTLIISPVITTLVKNHDSTIYLIILYIFVTILIVAVRYAGSQWVTWISTVHTIDDAEVKDWYIQNRGGGSIDVFEGITDPAAMHVSRIHLNEAVQAERRRMFWRKSKADMLVKKLAKSWDATIFLLNWYCRLSDVKRPMPYSSTWNIEVRVAYDSLMQNQKGIRLHSSFIHWRNAGDEVGSGILYFIVALLDRWIELIYGGPLIGLSADENVSLRIAIGFGLAYYLIGAVLLDYKAQHLHHVAQETVPITIQSKEYIRAAERYGARAKQKLYWKTLFRFLTVHVWVLMLTAALVWIFDGNKTALITFLSYVGAYTGLLLYQYNKIFSGPHTINPLLVAVLIGLPLGLILKSVNIRAGLLPGDRHFAYNDVIALAVGTWTAAFLSFRTAKIGMPRKAKLTDEKSKTVYHAYGGLGIDQKWSQSELEAFYEGVTTDGSGDRFVINPAEHPGTEIKGHLLSCDESTLSSIAIDAYPDVQEMARRIVLAWDRGLVTVELTSMRSVLPAEADVRALSYYIGGRLHILVEPDSESSSLGFADINSNCRVVAETLMHAAGESFFGLNHEHALIAESLLVCRYVNEEVTRVPERLRRALPSSLTSQKRTAFLLATRRELLQHLCYGLATDTTWEKMPLEIRRLLLQRCLGDASPLTDGQISWLHTNIPAENGCILKTRIARFDLGAILAVHKFNYLQRQMSKQVSSEKKMITDMSEDFQWLKESHNINSKKSLTRRLYDRMKTPFSKFYHSIGRWVKFFAIAPMGDPEYSRELNCVIQGTNRFLRLPIRFFMTSIWMYSRAVQSIVFPWFLFKGRSDLKDLWKSLKGTVITLKPGRVSVRAYDKKTTAFIRPGGQGTFKLFFYSGIHDKEPQAEKVLAVGTYSKELRLTSREEFEDGVSVNEYVYEYPAKRKKARELRISKIEATRIPLSRVCVRGSNQSAVVQYNHKGFVESGSYVRHGNLVRFKYHYRKNAKFDDELLRAEFVLPHLSCNVSWAAPPIRHPEKPERWIPHSRVQEATFVQGSDVYECFWVYNHQYHPVINTKLNGYPVETPEMIRHDWLGLLKKPSGCSFLDDNPLLSFPSVRMGFIDRYIRFNSKLLPASTSQKRSQLWKIWKQGSNIDGVVIRWLDERLLRQDELLKLYWRKRDRASLTKAEDYLAFHADTIMASAELSNDISAWTPLAIRLSDLFSFGQGGDAVVYTRTKTLQADTEDTLHVVAVDTGTWPNEGGGVSACRRDLINNLRTIRWNMVVESANDFGLPKYQTQENVESLKVIPLWGLDFMHPVHGMFFNKLDSEVDHLIKDATSDDIRRNFIPTLTALIKGARAINLSDADVKQATRAFVNLNTYFQDTRHWKEVWESDIVKESWRNLWLTDDLPGAKPPSEWFDTERPTLGHLDSALELWFRHLFIFSIPIPERIPAVFQASHHSVSAAYGIVCKIKRNCVLQIWDHAISWRETNLYLSSALCTLPPFIRNSLLGLMRLTSMLTLHHADYILPCADFFNPGWEVEIGTSQGEIEHRNVFRRKIDPVVNGITDMQKFAPVTEITTKQPTVTMLSHVWFAKDIKTALLAADIIVNQWGFSEYRLDIYGALNKAPIYSSECQEIIATKGLAPNVTLRGNGDPAQVLSKTWLFLNSSVSEGLPLALGEAALTGAPVVCTDVGASLRVLTDPETGDRYSEIVAPNDAVALARAQINMLALLGQWSKYALDEPDTVVPILPLAPQPQDVDIITKRMYDKSEQRRALGMMARKIVQASFSGERYLREHEQMLWVGKSRYESYGIKSMLQQPPPAELNDISLANVGGAIAGPRTYAEVVDAQLEKMAHPRTPWVDSRRRSRSAATSFTSLYTDPSGAEISYPPSTMMKTNPGVYSSNQNGEIVPAAGMKNNESGRLSFQARLKEREGRISRLSVNSRYVPSMLSEVQNAGD